MSNGPSPDLTYSLGRMLAYVRVASAAGVPAWSKSEDLLLMEALKIIRQRMEQLEIPFREEVEGWIARLGEYPPSTPLTQEHRRALPSAMYRLEGICEMKIKADQKSTAVTTDELEDAGESRADEEARKVGMGRDLSLIRQRWEETNRRRKEVFLLERERLGGLRRVFVLLCVGCIFGVYLTAYLPPRDLLPGIAGFAAYTAFVAMLASLSAYAFLTAVKASRDLRTLYDKYYSELEKNVLAVLPVGSDTREPRQNQP